MILTVNTQQVLECIASICAYPAGDLSLFNEEVGITVCVEIIYIYGKKTEINGV